jgi:hypothetical protein
MISSDQPSRIASRSMVRHVELYFSLMESIRFLIAGGRVTRWRLANCVIPFERGTEDTEKWVRNVVIVMSWVGYIPAALSGCWAIVSFVDYFLGDLLDRRSICW